MKNITYKFSRCFSLDMENGMSPSRLLEDKSLDQNRSAVREYSYRNIGMVMKDTRNANFTRINLQKKKGGGGRLKIQYCGEFTAKQANE
jgi:hypothetical protein